MPDCPLVDQVQYFANALDSGDEGCLDGDVDDFSGCRRSIGRGDGRSEKRAFGNAGI